MSTRAAVGFKIGGKYKVTYNHSDSYPEGLGQEVVDFVTKVVKTKFGLKDLKDSAKEVEMVNGDSKPTKEQIEEYKCYANTSVSNQILEEWYCLLRDAQGVKGLEEIWKGNLKVMIDGFDFLKYSLHCEYAYIINLDNDTIEFYEGFNRGPDEDSPLPIKQDYDKKTLKSIGEKYYPVKFKGSCPINEIPKNWIKKFYPEEEE